MLLYVGISIIDVLNLHYCLFLSLNKGILRFKGPLFPENERTFVELNKICYYFNKVLLKYNLGVVGF